ncbi:MAG: hypothetical protein ACXACP_11570 [Candidatus Hodarchaeales archaeon]
MKIFEDAHGYLNSSIRVYVNASSTLDKLFAIKLVVLSKVVTIDALIDSIGSSSDTPFQGHIEDSNFFLPMAAYEQRIHELQLLEDEEPEIKELKLAIRLHHSTEILKFIYGNTGFRTLLSINFKKLINDALFFILDVQDLMLEKAPSSQ